eukprot:167704_1
MLFSILVYIVYIIECNGYNNGIGPKPALGWNTWCSGGICQTDMCNEVMIIEAAQAMVSNGMHDAGWNRIHISDCWDACTRTSDGHLQADANRFPNGIKYVNDIIHSYGLLSGIYTSAGSATCSNGGRPSNCIPPGSLNHYDEDAQTFANWGCDYVKIDWCGHGLVNAQQQYTNFSHAMNKTGRSMWLELCRGYGYPPPTWVANVSNSWRIYEDHFDDWKSTRTAINKSINATTLSRAYNWAYNDFLMTGGQGCINNTNNPNVSIDRQHCPGQTDIEYITEFSMWSIIGSSLIVATDIRNMTDIMKKVLLNTEVIAVNQISDYPGGNIISSLTVNCDKTIYNACQVWCRRTGQNSVAIVLYNSGEDIHNITVMFDQIPNMNWKNVDIELRDLWEHKTIGYWVNEYTAEIQPHGVQFMTFTKQ